MKNLQDVKIDYYPSDVPGGGFHVVLFTYEKKRMIANVFEKPGNITVLVLSLLTDDVVEFARNPWRGDYFEEDLRQLIKEWKGGKEPQSIKDLHISSNWTSDERLRAIEYITNQILRWPHAPWPYTIFKFAVLYTNVIATQTATKLEQQRSDIEGFSGEIDKTREEQDAKNTKLNSQWRDR